MQPEQPQYTPAPSAQPQPVAQPQPFPTQPAAQPQQFAQPAPAYGNNQQLFTKKTNNAGRSIFALGIFIAVFTVIGIIGSFADASKPGASASDLVTPLIGLAIFMTSAVVMIVQGHTLKHATDLQGALRAVNTSLIASGAILLIDIVAAALSKTSPSITGLLTLVAVIYLFVAKNGIKKAA